MAIFFTLEVSLNKSIFFRMDGNSMKCILLRLYYANNCSAVIARRKYRQATGKRCKVSECSIRRMVTIGQAFEDKGSVVERRKEAEENS